MRNTYYYYFPTKLKAFKLTKITKYKFIMSEIFLKITLQ